ncbi:Lrp/AsnC family transcriptional regulator [uncultured Amphritea sp.]|mgnify:CR=1 FL=1|uniref:Lrp/AsnC family transcriptional regulator n=1 Tax=uncultured Amphritea sp. TaxID=981605 RepID=UPI00261C6633|nr:Lrp/AsnC family transcriptional regulator [uncultured Amphritea sp.]
MKKVILDALDIRILSAVQQHGQISKSRLSELVSLSPTPCWMRLDKLKKAGFIKGYRGDIAIDKILDLTRVYVTVSLKAHNRSNFERFEKRIQSVDEIVECSATGGGSDYVMKVITKTLHDFQNLIEQLLDEEIGIDRYYIYVVTREVKSTSLSLSKLLDNKTSSSD